MTRCNVRFEATIRAEYGSVWVTVKPASVLAWEAVHGRSSAVAYPYTVKGASLAEAVNRIGAELTRCDVEEATRAVLRAMWAAAAKGRTDIPV